MATATIYRIDFNHEYAGQNTSRLQLILSESFQNWAKLGNALQHTGSIASYPLAWLWAETPQDRLFEEYFFEKAVDQIVILMCVKPETAHGQNIEFLTENFEQCGVCYQLATKWLWGLWWAKHLTATSPICPLATAPSGGATTFY